MAKTARRSVTSNPSSLTKSSSQTNSNYSVESNSSSVSNPLSPQATLDPLRSTSYNQFTTQTYSNFSGRHGNQSSVRTFQNSSVSRSDNESISISNNSTNSTSSQQEFNRTAAAAEANRLAERERIKMEFYATYDVMTGVRIAATLGGFFGLMVFLVVYKSRSHSNETMKVLKDPKMAAVAAACMQEEEEREIQEALEATGLSLYPDDEDGMFFRRRRMFSLGNVSAPPILHRNFRFSSVGGGYSSLLAPPRRYSYSGGRRKSASESSRILSNYQMGSSFGTDDYFIETDDELENEFDGVSIREDESPGKPHYLLEVPITGQGAGPDSRRSSGMTCCSSESSYLERRCSAVTLGLSSLHKRPPQSVSRRSSTDMWDYYYPDIQVINPTPKVSPCPSERDLRERTRSESQDWEFDRNAPGPSNRDFYDRVHLEAMDWRIDGGALGTNVSGYNQYNKKVLRKGSFNNSDSIEEEGPELGAESCDFRRGREPEYDDADELKLVVRREMAEPTKSNHINHSNNNSSSFHSVQHPNADASRRAPLASLSSFKISSIDYQDSDLKSLGSDSVFIESYADTDDDMEQFSTDSDEISLSLGTDNQKAERQSQTQPELEQSIIPHKPTGAIQKTTFTSDKKSLSTSKRIRPTLERHRTISSASNDCILLIPQQSQELPMHDLNPNDSMICRPALSAVSSFDRTEGAHGFSIPASSRSSGGGTCDSRASGSNPQIDLQKPTTSFSYDNNDSVSCSSSSKHINRFHRTETTDVHSDDYHKSKTSYRSNSDKCENVEVNVIIENRPTQTTTISPSVILELPVIALPSQVNDDDDDPPRDPSLPGTSRKWSKETLF